MSAGTQRPPQRVRRLIREVERLRTALAEIADPLEPMLAKARAQNVDVKKDYARYVRLSQSPEWLQQIARTALETDMLKEINFYTQPKGD